jgi:glycosyltransferase involved in cell wall biosynthesis
MVSVIIPTYNRRDVLLRALDSVAQQTYANWELIVVDDGSTDGTAELFKTWQASKNLVQSVKYIKTFNGGVSRARNLGTLAATSPWLAFLDSDDEWLPEKLAKQILLTPHYQLIHGEEIWMRHGVRVNPMKKHAKSGGRVFSRCVELCFISPSTVLISRDLLLKMGGFREDYPVCEDYELWLRIAHQFEVGFVPTPVIKKYGGNPNQLSLSVPAMDYYRVRALVPFLENKKLSDGEREEVAESILSRSRILLKGYQKHGHPDRAKVVEDWNQFALNALTQAHSAHSAAERLPRSVDRLNL